MELAQVLVTTVKKIEKDTSMPDSVFQFSFENRFPLTVFHDYQY